MGTRVIVVGAGVIGLTAAHHLAAAGMRVEVIDRGEPGAEASWAGAGILPPGYPAFARTPLDQLRAVSTTAMPAFCEQLAADTGIDPGYRRSGGIEFLATGEGHLAELWRAEQLKFEPLSSDNLRALEPNVAPPPGHDAYELPGYAQVRNPRLVKALVAGCRRFRVSFRCGVPVEALDARPGRAGVSLADGTRREADAVVAAAGAWAGGLLRPLGVDLGVRPVRGQMALLSAKPGDLTRILLVGKRYLVPRGDGLVLAGSTEEPEAGFSKVTTPEAVAELAAFARGLVPALESAEVVAGWCGLRPGSADGRPSIGLAPASDNLIVAAGHFRAGTQLALGTAYLVRNLILNETPIVPLEEFAPGRVPLPPAEGAFRS